MCVGVRECSGPTGQLGERQHTRPCSSAPGFWVLVALRISVYGSAPGVERETERDSETAGERASDRRAASNSVNGETADSASVCPSLRKHEAATSSPASPEPRVGSPRSLLSSFSSYDFNIGLGFYVSLIIRIRHDTIRERFRSFARATERYFATSIFMIVDFVSLSRGRARGCFIFVFFSFFSLFYTRHLALKQL